MGIHDLLDQARHEIDLPQIRGESCVHSLNLSSLLQLQRQDVRLLLFSRGDCGVCEGARTSLSFDGLIENFQHLVEQHQLPRLQVASYTPRGWARRRESLESEAPGKQLSRRGFLRGLAGHSLEATLNTRQHEIESGPCLADVVSPGISSGLFPHVPRIEASRCSGCDACVRVCPHQAIHLHDQPLAYHVEARRCSGCKLCGDVCESNAVAVHAWTHAEGQVVKLSEARCTACGAPFHVPGSNHGAAGRCRICAANPHTRNLYQVL